MHGTINIKLKTGIFFHPGRLCVLCCSEREMAIASLRGINWLITIECRCGVFSVTVETAILNNVCSTSLCILHIVLAVSIGYLLRTAWKFTNYHYSLSNNPEEPTSQLLGGGNLKSEHGVFADVNHIFVYVRLQHCRHKAVFPY